MRQKSLDSQLLSNSPSDDESGGMTPISPINIIGDGICRTFSFTESISDAIVLSFYRKAQQMVVYLRTASCQYELVMADDESLQKSFQEFIAKIK